MTPSNRLGCVDSGLFHPFLMDSDTPDQLDCERVGTRCDSVDDDVRGVGVVVQSRRKEVRI